MTVLELIEKLKEMDPGAKALVDDDGYYRAPAISVESHDGQPAVIL